MTNGGENMKKKISQVEHSEYDFDIDYDLFTTEEIIKIFSFYSLLLKNHKHPIAKKDLLDSYQVYRTILGNISLEKKYDKTFEKKTGISIYRTIKEIKE